ncbi:MAG: cyclic nucleotide-binding domain-containing protein [Polyangiaceae bacterium]|nr:cyclic nucleotide-binding domain-containing protein [Polyangiaceae bacterium]
MPQSQPPAPLSVGELRSIPLFAGIPDSGLDGLAASLAVFAPMTGEILFREGETAREMFIVLEGEIEILKASHAGTDARVAILGPGDWFGEMSILDVQPRSATVRSLAPSRLVRVSSQDLDALYRRDLRSYALVVLNLARELSRRLRVADGIIADFVANFVDGYLTRCHIPPR